MNRPKMPPYHEVDMIQRLQKQSDEDRQAQSSRKSSLIRHGSTEKELRDYLAEHGYVGWSANILELELRGIERPGWVQLFEFHVQAKRQEGDWEALRGVCRCDERFHRFEVEFFDASQREARVHKATSGMITGQRPDRHWSYWPLMTLFAIVLVLAIIGAIARPERLWRSPNTEASTTAN